MGWIRSRIGNGPSRKAHGRFPHDLAFLMMMNYTKKTAHSVPLASARQHDLTFFQNRHYV